MSPKRPSDDRNAGPSTEDRRLDRLLHRALAPPPGATERLTRRALDEASATAPLISSRRARRQWAAWGTAIAASLLLALVVTWRLFAPQPPDTVPATPETATAPPAAALTISNHGDMLVITTAAGTTTAIYPGESS